MARIDVRASPDVLGRPHRYLQLRVAAMTDLAPRSTLYDPRAAAAADGPTDA